MVTATTATPMTINTPIPTTRALKAIECFPPFVGAAELPQLRARVIGVETAP